MCQVQLSLSPACMCSRQPPCNMGSDTFTHVVCSLQLLSTITLNKHNSMAVALACQQVLHPRCYAQRWMAAHT